MTSVQSAGLKPYQPYQQFVCCRIFAFVYRPSIQLLSNSCPAGSTSVSWIEYAEESNKRPAGPLKRLTLADQVTSRSTSSTLLTSPSFD